MFATQIYFTYFRLQKSGSDLDECQDALFTPKEKQGVATCDAEHPLRFAIADGLTTSFYSSIWADQLTNLFGQDGLEEEDGHWLPNQSMWTTKAHEEWEAQLRKLNEAGKLGFISKNHLGMSTRAAATFCGIEIQGASDGTDSLWCRQIAVGDSCLIHLSLGATDGFRYCYPCENAAEFSSATSAISNYGDPLPDSFGETNPKLTKGDVLLLATDALCEWMLKQLESGNPVWKSIVDAADQGESAFNDLVANARHDLDHERRLKNDDVALIVIKIGEEHPSWIDSKWMYIPNALPQPEPMSRTVSAFNMMIFSSPEIIDTKTNEQPLGELSNPIISINLINQTYRDCPRLCVCVIASLMFLTLFLAWQRYGTFISFTNLRKLFDNIRLLTSTKVEWELWNQFAGAQPALEH